MASQGNEKSGTAPRPIGPGGGILRAIGRTALEAFRSSTLRYIFRRLLWCAFLLVVISAVTFLIFNKMPTGDPAQMRLGRLASPGLIKQERHALGLDRPFYIQYWMYFKALFLHFNLGYSYHNMTPVKMQIFNRLPVTFSVTIGAVIIWIGIGIPVGIISAIKRRSLLDRVVMTGALVAISAPVFWLGLIALFLFSKDIGIFHLFGGAGSYVPFSQNPSQWFSSLVLPWCVLAAAFAAFYARMVRGNLIETMSEDYIRTARAKGLSERRVIFRHGLRAALTPVVTMAGMDIGGLLGGAVLTETIFNIPGIGRYAYDSILSADIAAVQGTVIFAAFFIITANLIVDILYAFLDPRVRY